MRFMRKWYVLWHVRIQRKQTCIDVLTRICIITASTSWRTEIVDMKRSPLTANGRYGDGRLQ